jgi:hypothetical protein
MMYLSKHFHFKFEFHIAVLQPPDNRSHQGLGYSHFARHYSGNHYCFLFLRILRCFSSPGSPPDCSGFHVFNMKGFPIRKSTDQRLFAPHHGISQLITSFIASWSQGIRRSPLFAFNFFTFKLTFNMSKNFNQQGI